MISCFVRRDRNLRKFQTVQINCDTQTIVIHIEQFDSVSRHDMECNRKRSAVSTRFCTKPEGVNKTNGVNKQEASSVTSGVPQGSAMGLLLFVLYTADIPLIAAEHDLGIHCYADDAQLYLYEKGGSAGRMVSTVTASACIAEMDNWMSSNRLKLNTEKTQFIWLGIRQQLQKADVDRVSLGSGMVLFQDNVNDLGVTIDNRLSMKEHVSRICRTSFYQLRQLRVV